MTVMDGKRSSPAPWFARTAIPPLILLSVLTSLAFNHSLITSERREEVRRHRTQMQVLQDLLHYRTTQLHALRPPRSSTISRWIGLNDASTAFPSAESEEEQEAIVRRLFSVGLDPRAYGFVLPTSSSSNSSQHQLGPRTTDWSDIFLGSKESRTSMSDKWVKVGAGIRNSFSTASAVGPSPNNKLSDSEQQELDKFEREWIAALSIESDTDSTQH